MRKLIFILVGAVVLFSGYKLFFVHDPMDHFKVGKVYTVNFTFPELAGSEFSDREKADQARDWLLYTVLSNSGLKRKELGEAAFDLAPVRYGFNSSLANFDYGDTRSRYLGAGCLVALIPVSNEKTRTDYIAHILDDIRKNQGEIPKKVYLFAYELNTEGQFAKLVRLENVNAKPYFTEAMGYYEATVASLTDLNTFLGRIDDITYARKDQGLVLGGRKLQSRSYGRVNAEDVAAIWQSEDYLRRNAEKQSASYSELDNAYKQKTGVVFARYNQALQSLIFADGTFFTQLSVDDKNTLTSYVSATVQGLPDSGGYEIHKTDYKLGALIIHMKAALDSAKQEIVARADSLGQGGEVASSSGFSLDPWVKFSKAAIFVRQFPAAFEEQLRPGGYTVQQLLDNLDHKNGDLFLYAIRNMQRSKDRKTAILGVDAEIACKYQKARYDGTLQGTAVGMTLFYTDLLAKIWSMNGFNSKPNSYIIGFKDHEQSFLSEKKVFTAESESLPAVRLWFGPNKNGFQSAQDTNVMAFARNTTQIFALGNDPGARAGLNAKGVSTHVELQASAEFDIALSWWNNHYEEVGRYEHQYERLNEIMKWSTLIVWLNNQQAGQQLSFLSSYKVGHDAWFSDWAKKNKDLKFKDWEDIVFFDKGYLDSHTEAMPILYSPKTIIAGGVSLAEKSLIREAPQLLPEESSLVRRANMAQEMGDTYKTFKETTISLADNDELGLYNIELTAKEGRKLRNLSSEVENAKFNWQIIENKTGGFSYTSKLDDVTIGELRSVSTGENAFTVGFKSLDLDRGLSLAGRVSDFPGDVAELFAKSPEVSRSFQGTDGNWYVQLSGSEQWTVMRINAEPSVDLQAGWQARTSGSQEESAIVEIKWVGEPEAITANKGALPPVKLSADLPPTLKKGLNDVRLLESQGEFEKALAQTDRLIGKFGDSPELLQLKMRNELHSGLSAVGKGDINRGTGLMNDALTTCPWGLSPDAWFNEVDNLIEHADVGPVMKQKFHQMADFYFTDRQAAVPGFWEGFGSSAREVPVDKVFADKRAKLIYSDGASFAFVDPYAPLETVLGQIRAIPGAKYYDISSVAIGRNTRMYAEMDNSMDVFGLRKQSVKFRVYPGSAVNNCPEDDARKGCDDRYSVKGPVYYVSIPSAN